MPTVADARAAVADLNERLCKAIAAYDTALAEFESEASLTAVNAFTTAEEEMHATHRAHSLALTKLLLAERSETEAIATELASLKRAWAPLFPATKPVDCDTAFLSDYPKPAAAIRAAVARFVASDPDRLTWSNSNEGCVVTRRPANGWMIHVISMGIVRLELDPDADTDLLKLMLYVRDIRRAVSNALNALEPRDFDAEPVCTW